MNRYVPNRRRVVELVAIAVLIAVVVPFVVFTVPQIVGADASFVVVSSSMSPAISSNDAIIVNDVSPRSVQEGDVIVFSERGGSDGDGIDVTSHRVVNVANGENGPVFETKGDANEEVDRGTVSASALVGRVAFTIPYIGHAIGFASTRLGFLALVAAPLGLLVLGELYDLARAARNSREASGEPAESDEGAETDGGTNTGERTSADGINSEECRCER